MGYAVEEQPFTYESVPAKNYIARKLQSASAKKIIICAHYDSGFVINDEGLTTTPTYGVDDNGSGVACVLEIAKWAKNVNLPYTVEFIFFDEEETGSNGSIYYINSLSDEEIANIAFVGNIDSVAAGDYCYIYGGLLDNYDVANPTITQAEPVYNAYALAKEMGLSIRLHPDISYRPTPAIGLLGDNSILITKKIPYIYMEATNWDIENSFGYSQTEKWGQIMHTDMDNLLFIRKEFGDRVNKNIENYIALLRLILLNGDKMNNKIE